MVETSLQKRSLAVQVDKLRSSHHLLAAQMKSQADSINARFDRLEAMWLQATGKAPLDPGPSIPPTPLNHSSSRPPDPLSLDCDKSVLLKLPNACKVVDGRNHLLLARNTSVGREMSRRFENPLNNFVEHMVGQKQHEVSMVENPKMWYQDGFGGQASLSTSSVTSPLPKKPPDPPDLCHSGMISATKASPRIKEAPLSSVNSKTSTHKLQRKYSSEEVYERMKLGLCMFCDELDISDHHLQHKRSTIYMIEGYDNQVSYDKATDDVSVKETVAYDKKGMKQAVCGSGYVNDCVDSKAVGNNHHVSESELASWEQSACKAVPDVVKMTTLRLGDSGVMIVNATGGVMDYILSFTDYKSSELSGQVTELLSMKSMDYAINVNDSGPRVWEPGGLPTEAAQCYWREKQYSQEDISLQTQKIHMKFEAALWEQHSSSFLTIRNAAEVIRLHEMNLFLCLQCSETQALLPREIRDGLVKTVNATRPFAITKVHSGFSFKYWFAQELMLHTRSRWGESLRTRREKCSKSWRFKFKDKSVAHKFTGCGVKEDYIKYIIWFRKDGLQEYAGFTNGVGLETVLRRGASFQIPWEDFYGKGLQDYMAPMALEQVTNRATDVVHHIAIPRLWLWHRWKNKDEIIVIMLVGNVSAKEQTIIGEIDILGRFIREMSSGSLKKNQRCMSSAFWSDRHILVPEKNMTEALATLVKECSSVCRILQTCLYGYAMQILSSSDHFWLKHRAVFQPLAYTPGLPHYFMEINNNKRLELEATIDKKKVQCYNIVASNIFIEWKEVPPDQHLVSYQFQCFHLWGQRCSEEGSIVTA